MMYEKLNSLKRDGLEQSLKLHEAFQMMTKNPMAVQTKLLMDLLLENQDTEYGKKYEFV